MVDEKTTTSEVAVGGKKPAKVPKLNLAKLGIQENPNAGHALERIRQQPGRTSAPTQGPPQQPRTPQQQQQHGLAVTKERPLHSSKHRGSTPAEAHPPAKKAPSSRKAVQQKVAAPSTASAKKQQQKQKHARKSSPPQRQKTPVVLQPDASIPPMGKRRPPAIGELGPNILAHSSTNAKPRSVQPPVLGHSTRATRSAPKAVQDAPFAYGGADVETSNEEAFSSSRTSSYRAFGVTSMGKGNRAGKHHATSSKPLHSLFVGEQCHGADQVPLKERAVRTRSDLKPASQRGVDTFGYSSALPEMSQLKESQVLKGTTKSKGPSLALGRPLSPTGINEHNKTHHRKIVAAKSTIDNKMPLSMQLSHLGRMRQKQREQEKRKRLAQKSRRESRRRASSRAETPAESDALIDFQQRHHAALIGTSPDAASQDGLLQATGSLTAGTFQFADEESDLESSDFGDDHGSDAENDSECERAVSGSNRSEALGNGSERKGTTRKESPPHLRNTLVRKEGSPSRFSKTLRLDGSGEEEEKGADESEEEALDADAALDGEARASTVRGLHRSPHRPASSIRSSQSRSHKEITAPLATLRNALKFLGGASQEGRRAGWPKKKPAEESGVGTKAWYRKQAREGSSLRRLSMGSHLDRNADRATLSSELEDLSSHAEPHGDGEDDSDDESCMDALTQGLVRRIASADAITDSGIQSIAFDELRLARQRHPQLSEAQIRLAIKAALDAFGVTLPTSRASLDEGAGPT